MLLANSFDSSSLFVDKELDSAVESIRPFISVTQKETTTFLQQVFFSFLIALTTVQTTQAILRMYVNKVLDSPTSYIHSIRISNDIFPRLISDSVNIRNFRHDKPFRDCDLDLQFLTLVIFPLPFQFRIV